MARLSRDEAAALLDRFQRYLRTRRLPVTTQRIAIARTVFEAEEHLSVEALEKKLKQAGIRVGTATVYRTLDSLVESGLLRAHDFGEGFRRFEPVTDALPHEHLVCVRCGSVQEFQNERLERMIPLIADEFQFLHQRHRVEIFGVCRSCRSRDLGSLLA
jgi:Fur family ferric uptake transcriptional regulator